MRLRRRDKRLDRELTWTTFDTPAMRAITGHDLARFHAERSRGIVHAPAWVEAMERAQAVWDDRNRPQDRT